MRKTTAKLLVMFPLVFALRTAPGLADEAMVKYASDQVRLYTDIRPKDAAIVIDEIEFFVEYIESFFQHYKLSQKKENPIRCRLYANLEEYEDWVRKANLGFRAGAFYSPSDNCIMAPYHGGDPVAFSTLRHECAHQIIHRYVNNPPRWFDEGMATYFEGVEFDANRNVISHCSLFSKLPAMRSLIAGDLFIDWDFFFDDARRNRWWDEARRKEFNVGNFYTQSWGVVFYYLHADDAKTRNVFAKLLKGLNTGRERTKLIEQDLAENMDSFKDFFSRDHQRISKLYHRAYDYYRQRQYEKCFNAILPVLKENPYHYASIRLCADDTWDWKRYDLSVKYWRALKAKDEREVLYRWKISRCLTKIGKAKGDDALLEEALAEAKAAVRASRKKNPYCLAAQAMAHFALGDVRKALATMRSATRFKCDEHDMYEELEKEYSDALRIGE